MKFICHFAAVSLLAAVSARAAVAPLPTGPVTAHNFIARLTVSAPHLEAAYGDTPAPEGRQFLVLHAKWENVIDAAFAASRDLPVSATDDNLSESLAVAVDGRDELPAFTQEANTANLDTNDTDIVGHTGGAVDASYLRKVVGVKNAAGKRALAYFALEKPGASVEGDLLFAVPKAGWRSLELVYRHPVGGTFRTVLAGTAEASTPEKDPAGMQSNEVLALAARLSEDPARVDATPPQGRRYVAVDLQGRSLVKVLDQYPPYDPSHPAGAEWKRPDPAGWLEFAQDVELLVDGSLPCNMEPIGDPAAQATFPPDSWHHIRLVYLVPAGEHALDLVCFFPTYQIPGIEGDVIPKGLRFHLAGPAAPAVAKPAGVEHQVQDGPLAFSFTGHRLTRTFAGETAADGESFLVVTLSIKNTGTEMEEFKASDQLSWFKPPEEAPDKPRVQEKRNGKPYDPGESAETVETPPDDITVRGPLAPPAFFYVPPGETRRCEVVWRVPSSLSVAHLGLKGNTAAEKFPLPLAASH